MRIIRIILILLVITLCVLTACSSPAQSTSPTTQYTPTQQPPTILKTTTALTPKTKQSNTLLLQIGSVTSPVSQGAEATLTAQTVPAAQCDIDVYYKSGRSSASGLSTKVADDKGQVSWTWKVGIETTPGSWKIVITASQGGETGSQTTYFEVK
jgi:hypothetical protein